VNFGIIDLGSSFNLPLEVDIINPVGDTVYSQFVDIPSYYGVDTTIQFPDWDASGEPGSDTAACTVIAQIAQVNYQNYNTTQVYSKFYLNTESGDTAIQEYALDDAGMNPAPGVGNDIPQLVGIRDKGIGFVNTSGSFAMKFQLARPDTFYGVRAYFTFGSGDPDYARVSLLNGDSNSCIPLDTVSQTGKQSTMVAEIGPNWDQFSTYYFPQPIPLQPGTYWVSVSQLGVVNMGLGGNSSRGGGQLVRSSKTAPEIAPIYTFPYGTQWGSGSGDNNGNVSCSFAVEMPAGSGNWKPMMPDSGLWPVMDSSNSLAWHFIPNFETSPCIGAGTYLPMIRAIFAGNPPSSVKTSPAIPNFGLESNYPNPFDPTATSTSITFTLGVQSSTSLTICNVLGEVVKKLVDEDLTTGPHIISWDGRDDNGAIVPAGIYLISLTSGGHRVTEKIVVTK
jgi:hypothetical protein